MAEKPFTFVNYDRISDTLMYLSMNPIVTLKFIVDLTRLDRFDNEKSFHMETKFTSKKFGRDSYTITRTYNCYYAINYKIDETLLGCTLRPADVQVLNMLIDTSIMPWYVGNNRVYSMIDDKMVINKPYTDVTLPISEMNYLRFAPVVINYEDSDSYKEGIRLEINGRDNCIDITLDKFMEFVYIMHNTDMIGLASSMLAYVKTPPYQVNASNFGSSGLSTNRGGYTKNKGNFFDK